MLYVLCEASVGPQALKTLQWPLMFVFSNIDVADFFVSRVGSFVILIWTAGITFNLAVHIFCLSYNLEEALGLGESGRQWIVGIVTVVVWAGSAAISSPVLASTILTHIVNVGDLTTTFTLMTISVGIAWIESHRRQKSRVAGAAHDPFQGRGQ